MCRIIKIVLLMLNKPLGSNCISHSSMNSPGGWSALVGIDTLGGIPFSSSSMLVPSDTGDLGAGAGAAAGARLWNVTGGPGNKDGLDHEC